MAEQLAFNQGVGQGGAVEADQRLFGPGRSGMNRLGDQLFADPGFARDQHGQVAAAHQGDFFEQTFVGFALPDQLFIRCAVGLSIEFGLLLLIFDP